jgi:nicotinamide mononucleotide transporter
VSDHVAAVTAATWLLLSQTAQAIAFAPAFTLWESPTTWLEVVAFALALVMVALNIRVSPWAWPFAIASSALYGWLFWHVGLFGEAGLQGFFIAMGFWGWWQWLRGTAGDGQALRVRPLGTPGRLGVLAALALAWPALGLYLDRATTSTVPWWDALPTAASVIGQWLLGRKYLETWPTWLAVNVVSVGLFAVKALWLTAILYAIFAVLSVVGWRAWARLADPQPGAALPPPRA